MSCAMNYVAVRYMNTQYLFDPKSNSPVELLYVLDDGLKVQAERQARMSRGEFKAEDYDPRDL
jgi:hypothetical protein